MSKFYDKYFRDFGELLTDMERNGIMLDNDHLRDAEIRAKEERALMVQVRYVYVLTRSCTYTFISTPLDRISSGNQNIVDQIRNKI